MRRAFAAWWTYGYCRPWGWCDYLRHFGLVALATFVCIMHWISIMTYA